MFHECRHIKISGSKCQAAALRGEPFCYFHARQRVRAARPTESHQDIQLPPLEDRAAIQVALSDVAAAIAGNRIDLRRAALLLCCLRVASQNARNRTDLIAANPVQEVTHTAEGNDLAPSVENYSDEFNKLMGDKMGEAFCDRFLFDKDEDPEENEDRAKQADDPKHNQAEAKPEVRPEQDQPPADEELSILTAESSSNTELRSIVPCDPSPAGRAVGLEIVSLAASNSSASHNTGITHLE